MSSKFV